MKDLNVTYIQADLSWEDKQANLEHFDELMQQVPASADLVLLPETFNTGFPVDPLRFAEPIGGPTMQWMAAQAQRLGAVVSGTFLLETEGHYHNTLVWMRPDGSYELYHKRHTFSIGGEKEPIEKGTDSLVVELSGWHIKPMVCYDIRFPVWSRNHFDGERYEYDLGLYLANFPDSRQHVWDTLLMSRAIENQAYYIGVNRVGDDPEGIHYSGGSQVINPRGQVIAKQDLDQEGVVCCTLEATPLIAFRQKFPVGRDWDPFFINNNV